MEGEGREGKGKGKKGGWVKKRKEAGRREMRREWERRTESD